MRDLLAHADLDRYAGQFVWLEMSYDEEGNRAFMEKFGASATPTFFVIDPHDEHVIAMQTGALSLRELTEFLDRGANGFSATNQLPAGAALTRGDTLLAEHPAEAAKAYEEALRITSASWAQHELAEASLAQALQDSKQYHPCAETAVSEAATMKRDVFFVRTVVAGMWCLASVDPASWADAALAKLKPMAEDALTLPITVRDHRDAIYRTLMFIAVNRNDNASAAKYGDRWLAELDAIKPRSEEERTALDIARVENIQAFGDPNRILPALTESEQAMPNSYIASLRLAQVESTAKHYVEAIAACNRGLQRNPGALGRTWLLEIKADALQSQGKNLEAHKALEDARQSAQGIPSPKSREMNVARVEKMLDAAKQSPKK